MNFTRLFVFVATGLAAFGCRSHGASPSAGASAVGSVAKGSPSASPGPESHPKRVRARPAASLDLETAPGPAPSGSAVAREVRETAALALLTDATFAQRMPVLALEPGREFDWELRERVAPRVVVPMPRLRLAESTARGPLGKEVVQRIVRQNFGRYRSCAADSGGDTTPTGIVTLELTILPNGGLTRVTVSRTTLNDAAVVRCLRDATESLVFPARSEATEAVQVLEFSASSG